MIKDFKGIIVNLSQLNDLYFILEIQIPGADCSELGIPGQFYEIQMPDFPNKLRIPISIFKIEEDIVSFFIKKIGEGTQYLSKLENGTQINILGPLGNHFSFSDPETSILLISGGIGYAPLFFLKKMYSPLNAVWMHGGKSTNEIFSADIIYTDDGSEGKKGFITDDLREYLKNNTIERIYTCGPKIMMKKICEIANEFNIPVEASLEEYMACGVGVCHGCVVKIKNYQDFDYKTVCKDGPIFTNEEILWD